MKKSMNAALGAGLAVAMLMPLGSALAQDGAYPSKPITLVVPFPAGGVVDIVGRAVGDKLGAALKTTVVVDNRPGAGGTLGAGVAANAKPDGYTLFLGGSATHVFAPSLYKNMNYDPVKSFAPLGLISTSPLVVVVNPNVKANNVPELVKTMKDAKDKANYGTNGNGTFPHLATELFKQANKLQTVHVPYGGGPAAMTALVRNDVQMSINHVAVVQGMIKAGKIRPLATTGAERSRSFPDLPTLTEAGIPLEAKTWWGLFAPKQTPQPVIDKLAAALNAAMANESLRAQLLAQGEEPATATPEQLAGRIDAETAKWSKVIRDAKISLD